MDDHVKLIGMFFAFMTPVLGLLMWIVKKGMTDINSNLKNIGKGLQDQYTDRAVDKSERHAHRKQILDSLKDNTEELKVLVDQHSGNHDLCRLSILDVDKINKASDVTLGGA